LSGPCKTVFARTAAIRQASAIPHLANSTKVLHSPVRFPRRRAIVVALLFCLPLPVVAADEAPACPIGSLVCELAGPDWSLCKQSDLLDFYVPGLPTSGERTLADTDITSLHTQSADGENYVLTGDVSIRQLDQLIRADRFTYAQTSTQWSADGNVRYQDRDILLSASDASGSTVPSRATLANVRYQLLSARGNGRAATAALDGDEHARLTDTSYSTCPLDSPGWEFRASEIELDQANGVGHGRDVTLRLGNVPVFWMPYASFPIDDRRKSGFLYPEIGYNDDLGVDIATPYYLNLAPNYDATLTPRLMTERGLMLGGQFRYLTDSSRGTVELEWLPDDRETGDQRSLFHWDDSTRFGANWGTVIDLNHVSDDRYFEDFGRSLNIAATTMLPSSAYLVGNGSWWSARVGGDEYQITDPAIPLQAEPFRRLPRVTFNAEHQLIGGLDAGIDSEFVSFARDESVDGSRLDLFPYLAYPLEAAAWFVRPQIGYRYTSYEIDRDSDKSPDRGLPIASLDAGLRLERGLTFGDGGYTQTLEPRLYYLNVPYENQDNLPLFDTQEVPFSFGQLFRSNRFVGADRQMNANNLTLALTSRIFEDSTGNERLSASIGQIRYFDDQRVQLYGLPETDFSGSTYVGELDLRINDRWRVVLAEQWNPNSEKTELATAALQNRFGDGGAFNISYRFRRDLLEQTDISAAIPLNHAWRLVGRWNYSLRDDSTLDAFAGIEHESCCVTWRMLARRYVSNYDQDMTNSLYFEVELKGIGSIGQKTGNFLRRAILGYQ